MIAAVEKRGASLPLVLGLCARIGLGLGLGLGLGAALTGCGPIRYVGGVTSDASSAVDDAREAKAEELAPYWWTRAVAYLQRARYEAAEADWQAANRFGRLAKQAADTAISEAAAAAKDPSRRPLPPPSKETVAPAKERGERGEPGGRVAPAKEQ